LLLLAACTQKPTGFGVDVEARTNMLTAAVRNSIVSARVLVSGAEAYQRDIAGVGRAAQSGAFRFRYVPGVHAGILHIIVEGLNSAGAPVAGGTAPPVTLVDGKAVDAVLTLATNGNGVACMAATDCISGNCVDGVCCDSACPGTCQSCNLPHSVGQCTLAPSGSDPRGDCAAKIAMQNSDGGTSDDGGTSGVSDVMSNPQACAGTCNGMGACGFPDSMTSCGTPFCAASGTVGNLFCDGNGGCGEQDTMCNDFVCDSGACKTRCNANTDCLSTDFCNLNINQCVTKHVNSTMCANAFECASGFCANGVCCNTDCSGAGQVCNANGNVGKCQCQSHPCPNGITCQLFYKDGDGDGYGDANGTIANGNAVAGCTGDTPPAGHVADNTDCNDADNRQHPGQGAFFGTPSNVKGDFDYNCDGTIEKGIPEYPGSSCGFCGFVNNGGILQCTKNGTCGAVGNQSTLACGFSRFGIGFCLCCNLANSGFLANVACGTDGTLYSCGTCTIAGGGATSSMSTVQQTCH
jgi:hypothetical protein